MNVNGVNDVNVGNVEIGVNVNDVNYVNMEDVEVGGMWKTMKVKLFMIMRKVRKTMM